MSDATTPQPTISADQLDQNCGIAMAYFGELVTRGDSAIASPSSQIAAHNRRHSGSQQNLNPTYVAWRSIAAAGETAGFAEYMRHTTEGGVNPRPQAALARVSLLGAARALYVLTPEKAEDRLVNTARLANQEAADAKRLLDEWAKDKDIPNVLSDELTRQITHLPDSAAKVLRKANVKETSKINEIDLLRSVAPYLGNTTDSESALFRLWFQSSGVSHARSWVWSTVAGADPQYDFVSTWLVPVELMTRAWELWNLRRGMTDPPHLPPVDWEPDRSIYGPPAS